jgi:hypothetical protein
MIKRFVRFLFPLLALAGHAQSPRTDAPATADLPTVSFACDWPAYTPQQVSVTVKSSGAAHYASSSPNRPADHSQATDEDYEMDFTMSQATRERIFKLAEQAGYFNGDFEFHKHAVAHTGKKTLAYSDASRHFQTVFNFSENRAIDELAHIFGGISLTLQHGRRIQFLRRFDKLGLEAELKGAEQDLESDNLVELQLIAPLLESIANDKAILHIARQRAEHLLAKSGYKTKTQ